MNSIIIQYSSLIQMPEDFKASIIHNPDPLCRIEKFSYLFIIFVILLATLPSAPHDFSGNPDGIRL
ncbi:MAG: hypothetical protein DWQ05_13355 [Calditrichaeota bacterium]|nr:MAG: hypothetical protein DWQ05_13355 [Calditrichota bacterium]